MRLRLNCLCECSTCDRLRNAIIRTENRRRRRSIGLLTTELCSAAAQVVENTFITRMVVTVDAANAAETRRWQNQHTHTQTQLLFHGTTLVKVFFAAADTVAIIKPSTGPHATMYRKKYARTLEHTQSAALCTWQTFMMMKHNIVL